MSSTRPADAAPDSSQKNVSQTVKLCLLVILCMQNAVYTILRRYSTGVLKEEWSPSSVLLMGEVIKLAVAVFMTLSDKGSTSAEGSGIAKLWWLMKASLPMAIPALVYWAMNRLSYVSLNRIDASTFTVIAQMKILTTAVFSVLLMGRKFHSRKWRALILLVLGVTLVANGSFTPSEDDEDTGKGDAYGYIVGVAAVFTEVSLSGFVSVFFEKVLKSRVVNLSVWDRNFQLAVYSILLYLPFTMGEEGGVFHDWTSRAVVVSFLGSTGGILVAFTTKYTDAVLKTFATSGAIIVTAIAGYLFLDAPLDIPIAIGAGCTVLSLLNYSDDGGGEARNVTNEQSQGSTVSIKSNGKHEALRPSPLGSMNASSNTAGEQDEARQGLLGGQESTRTEV